MVKIMVHERIKYAGDVYKALLELGWDMDAAAAFLDSIHDVPITEYAPVEHGRWLQIINGVGVCSNCYKLDEVDPIATNCRFCGARMDG